MNAPHAKEKNYTADELATKFLGDNFLLDTVDSTVHTNLINIFRDIWWQGAVSQQNNFTLIQGKRLTFTLPEFCVTPGLAYIETLPTDAKKD